MFAKQEDRAVGGRREMQTVVVKRSCARRSCLHSLEKGDYLSRCVIEGGKMTSKM